MDDIKVGKSKTVNDHCWRTRPGVRWNDSCVDPKWLIIKVLGLKRMQ